MNIEIIQKPDQISLEQITDLLHEAHTSTAGKGMHFMAYTQTPEDTKRRLGNNGVFYVALCDGELAGCAAVRFHDKGKKWYCKDPEYAEIKMVAVGNQYKGLGLSNKLYEALEDYAFARCDFITMNTAVENTLVVERNKRHGWKVIDYCSWKSTDYYSVVMGKWKNCPFSDRYIKTRYLVREKIVNLIKDRNGDFRIPIIH